MTTPVDPAGTPVDPAASPAATISPEAEAKLKAYGEATKQVAIEQGNFGDVIARVKGQMDKLTEGLVAAETEMNKAGSLSESGAARFILFANSAIGVKKAFEGLGGVSSTGLSTFGGQLASIKESLASGKTVASEVAEKLKAGLASMGVSQNLIAKAGADGIKGLIAFSEQQTTSADNALKLSAAYVHQMAATGGLSQVAVRAGDDFGNMNAVMAEQAKMLVNVGQAANKLPEQAEAGFKAFMTIPGAIDSVIEGVGRGGSSLSGLATVFKLADGTGRNFEEVNADIAKSIKAFTGDLNDSQNHMKDSMQFTERFTELSSKFKISIDDVKGGLTASTDNLMKYTNAGNAAFRMTEGVAGMMNEYTGGLLKAGLTGKEATEVIGGMTNAFGSLNTAQKAFLSAQTGGPGGLMGAAQIEQMIRKGDLEGVKNKVMEVMKKQLGGNIITQDQAAQSEAGAQQYERQRALLQKGPLGAMAQTDKQVAALTDMLSGKQKGTDAISGLTKDGKGLSDAINKGSKWEEKSAGFLSRIVGSTDAIAKSAMFTNLNIMQSSQGTISSGNSRTEVLDKSAREARARSTNYRDRAAAASGKDATFNRNQQGPAADRSREQMKDAVVGGLDVVRNAPADVVRAVAGDAKLVGAAVKGAPKPQAPETIMRDEIENARQKASARPSQSLVAKGAMPSLDINSKNFGQTTSPAKMVAGAQRGPVAPRAPGGAGAPTYTVEESGSSNSFNVKVKVEVNDKEVSAQSQGINPAGAN